MSVSIGSRELPELRDAHEAAKLGPYLRDVWSRRSYIRHVAVNELRNRQITNVLGNLWHLLNPALTIGVYYLIFGVILKSDRGVDNFLLFLTIGLFVFQFSQKSTIDGAESVVDEQGPDQGGPVSPGDPAAHLDRHRGPRIDPDVRGRLRRGARRPGRTSRWRWLMLPPLLVLMTVFNAGTAMIAARLTTHFADTTQILPFVFRLLLYVSGVIFSVDAYVDNNGLVEHPVHAQPVLLLHHARTVVASWAANSADRPAALGRRVVGRDRVVRIRLVPRRRGELRP